MQKKLLVLGAVSLAALSLASCSSAKVTGGSITLNKGVSYSYSAVTPVTASAAYGDLDVYINYEGTSGVTFRGTSWYNTIENKLYTQGALLPVWEELGKVAGVTVREACGYKATSNDNAFTAVATAGYKSETDSNQKIDLFYNSINNLKTAGNSGNLVDLLPLIESGKMPNLEKYLNTEEGKAIKEQALINGHLYYTPYVDGTNDVRKAFIMDTTMVKKVLVKGSGDTDNKNGGVDPSKNGVQSASYKPFITESTYTIQVSKNGVATDYVVPAAKNIIEQQNELLANGCSGQALADQLVDYINARYGALYGLDNPWDLYISESAAYNVDELIALMRVVKANPKLLTGNADANIQVFFPRGESSSSIENVYDLAQLWGVQGVDSSNGNYYFAADGTLNSLETTKASYDVLDYISQIYDEGLILSNFYVSSAMSTGTRYLDKYFKKTAVDSEYGFMMYDDISIATQGNDEIDGLGTSASSRKNATDTNTGYSPVLAPVTYWTTTGNSAKADITDTTNKTLTRYYESSRSLQDTSWAIPTNSDNVNGAVAMMDAMYSEYGQLVQNYGPSQYWTEGGVTADLVSGEKNAILSPYTKLELSDSKVDYWSFMRGYLGAGHGVGHIRLNGANLQSVNYYGQQGLKNIQSAIASGALNHASLSTTYSWNVTVPTMFKTSVSDDKNAWDGITGFWQANKINKNEGWVNVVTSTYSADKSNVVIKTAKNGLPITWEKMMAQQDVRDKNCLYLYAQSVKDDDAAVPSYAKKN